MYLCALGDPYRKFVEEPSCIRRPDTGQQSRGFRVLYREPQYKRKQSRSVPDRESFDSIYGTWEHLLLIIKVL